MNDTASAVAVSGRGLVPSGSLGVTEETPRQPVQLGATSRPELQGGKGSGVPNLNSFMGLNTATTSVAAIAKIIQESNLQARESARLDRQQARDTDVSKQLEAADKTRDMANFNLAATAVTSAISMVGSVVSIAGAVKAETLRGAALGRSEKLNVDADRLRNPASVPSDLATKEASRNLAGRKDSLENAVEMQELGKGSGASDLKDATTLKRDELKADRLDTKAARDLKTAEVEASNIDRKFTTAAQVTTETGKIVGAALQRVGAEKDAERMEIQAAASVARTKAEDQSDFMRAYADNVRAVLEKLSAIQQAEADTNRSIIRNLG
jgi:hypothetical protein